MIGLVVATHARLADELLAAAELIIGPLEGARAVAVLPEHGPDEIQERIRAAVEEVNRDKDGVVIMTDMFGGTPSNVSLSFLDPDHIEVVTGVNLPMVIKFFHSQESLSLKELAGLLKGYGQQAITVASE
ncbi:MAG: PTS sugar transporter subunit IIA, partial [Deltaproteobacteria bacterium]